ncbi:PKD domain-containing protein [Thermoflavifilum thermophilum]|uniref:O-Glycosyl hydrolase n=1 Tax=Thermoflavifilum thermophilum TaxID=1393122 RepID=A0A1I7MX93_9BACT|nr:PKD domain-containing protein [Thermoflavifilum thermophilum]SFV27032.1 O-Glycosyl hydrolase [Thermoflavifilum thermophilum]
MKNILILTFLIPFCCAGCKKNSSSPNRPPTVQEVKTTLLLDSPAFTFQFTATATDPDLQSLTYLWDFGDGGSTHDGPVVTHHFEAGKNYTVQVKVSDGQATSSVYAVQISTQVSQINIDLSQHFQTIEGLGGFGMQNQTWTDGPFADQRYINDLLNDLGLSMIRVDLPYNFELHPGYFNIDTQAAGRQPLKTYFPFLQAMQQAGVKIIASVWSPPAWMKSNGRIDNGTGNQASAPKYNPNPGPDDNELRLDMYDDFAHMCAVYVQVLKEHGIDLYALSIQNEPRFSEWYESCVYDGEALHNLLKIVGDTFQQRGYQTKLFIPEDIGWLDGIKGMVMPSLQDPATLPYVGAIAVHGYAFDGVTANSPDAQTWQTMYSWGAPYGIPLWMTETSGFSNDWNGAMSLAKAMYTAFRFGNISAWLFWTISTSQIDSYSLMDVNGNKSLRYFVSKNFYKFVRPGYIRAGISADTSTHIYPLVFKDPQGRHITVILINDGADQAVQLSGNGLPQQFVQYLTNANTKFDSIGMIPSSKAILLPASSVTTLYGTY